jgi:DNA end-binding protein Ku
MGSVVWRGRLAFGLVSIPVRLYRAARRERVRFRQVYRPAPAPEAEAETESWMEAEAEPLIEPASAAAPARIHVIRGVEPESAEPQRESGPVERIHHAPPVAASRILKGYEYEKDRFVTLDQQEVKALRPKTSEELEIVEFVRLTEIDPVYFDASYYAAPDRGGEKPYAMLCEALRASGYAAVGTFAMHGREHVAVIRPGRTGLLVHTLFYALEIHAEDEYAAPAGQVNPKELELAQTLIRALAAPFDVSRFKDAFEERVRALLEARAEQGLSPLAGATEPGPAGAPVADLMEALKRSLEMVRKPVARAEPERRRSRKRTK